MALLIGLIALLVAVVTGLLVQADGSSVAAAILGGGAAFAGTVVLGYATVHFLGGGRN